MGATVVIFVAIYLAWRYWIERRHSMTIHVEADIRGDVRAQRRSLSSGAEHPSMDVD
jgi:hypothetical protein